MASFAIIDAGIYVPAHALDRWASNPTVGPRHVIMAGDSTMQGTNSLVILQGNTYQDSYVDRMRRLLGSAIGPLLGQGWYGTWRSRNNFGFFQSSSEYSNGGAMAAQLATDNTVLAPFSAGVGSGGAAADTLTWTAPINTATRVVNDAQTFNGSVAIGAGSVGVNTATFAGAGVLNAASAISVGTGPGQFPATGVLHINQAVPIGNGNIVAVTYTGIAGSQFTGCTSIAGNAFTIPAGAIIANTNIVVSATAAFTANDQGSVAWGTNIVNNNCVVTALSATQALIFVPSTGAGQNGSLGIEGRNQAIGGVQQIDVYYADFQFGSQWSYSINGGAFINGPAISHNNPPRLKKFSVVTANPTTFTVRAANAAGAAALAQFYGMVMWSVVPTATTSGVLVHNMAMDGAQLHGKDTGGGFLTGPTSLGAGGDALRLLDSSDPRDTAAMFPSLFVQMMTNDYDNVTNPATYVADLQTIYNRINPYCDMLIINAWEQNRTTGTPAVQSAYRAAVKAWAASHGVAVLDIYDAWAAMGVVGWQAAITAGLVTGDGTHPTSVGHADIGARIARALAIMTV